MFAMLTAFVNAEAVKVQVVASTPPVEALFNACEMPPPVSEQFDKVSEPVLLLFTALALVPVLPPVRVLPVMETVPVDPLLIA